MHIMPAEVPCLSFPLCDRATRTRMILQAALLRWTGSPASPPILRWGSHKSPRPAAQAPHAPAMHTHPCSARDAPYVHPGSCTVRGEDAHVHPRTTQEQSPRVPPATCTTAAAPHARPLRTPRLPPCPAARAQTPRHRRRLRPAPASARRAPGAACPLRAHGCPPPPGHARRLRACLTAHIPGRAGTWRGGQPCHLSPFPPPHYIYP